VWNIVTRNGAFANQARVHGGRYGNEFATCCRQSTRMFGVTSMVSIPRTCAAMKSIASSAASAASSVSGGGPAARIEGDIGPPSLVRAAAVRRITARQERSRSLQPEERGGVLLQDQRPHLVPERRLLEVGEPAVGRDQREVRAEQHLRAELRV